MQFALAADKHPPPESDGTSAVSDAGYDAGGPYMANRRPAEKMAERRRLPSEVSRLESQVPPVIVYVTVRVVELTTPAAGVADRL